MEKAISNTDTSIFLSYCSADNHDINRIDNLFLRFNIKVTRDIRDLAYNADIHKFMDKVKTHDKIILYVSDSYLKSVNCMYEGAQVLDMQDRVIIILKKGTKLFGVDDKKNLISYWEEKMDNIEIENKAKEIRRDIIEQVYIASSGHPGGSLSIADIMAVLYFDELNIDEKNPKWEDRDRLVLSKGHCSPALYSCLANRGFFDVEKLKTFRNINSNLQGHPDMNKVPGVDISSGSLGQGLSCANGMAIAGKMDNKNYRVYCILGDGEIEEGQVWEAAMASNKYKLDNLCVIVDNNNLQIDGTIEEVMSSYPIDEKFKSFGFQVINIDGHNIQEIIDAFDVAKNVKDKPTCIIAKTIKGKGVSYMENDVKWHGIAPNEEQYQLAMKELGGAI